MVVVQVVLPARRPVPPKAVVKKEKVVKKRSNLTKKLCFKE